MLRALIAGLFIVVLVWMRHRESRASAQARRLRTALAETQGELEKSQHRSQQLIGFMTDLHEQKVSPVGRVAWAELADFTAQTAGALLGMQIVLVLKRDAHAADYRCIAARGLSPEQVSDLRVRPGEGILGSAAQGAKVLVVNEPSGGLASQESFLSDPYIVLPLWVHSQVNGLMVFCRPQTRPLGTEDLRLATLMAKQTQMTMENLDLYETRQQVYADVVNTLAAALGAKDPGSQQHAVRCRALVRDMAKALQLPESLSEQIEYGALLHDIGKLGIVDGLLAKPEALTEPEYSAMKKHSQVGYDILRGIGFFKGIAPIVLYHHEWINGQGYPEGLAGEEIPLGARMVSIAEAWDTMVTDQPYRKALTKNNAIAELRQLAGSQFDPKLVDVFLRIIDQMERAASGPVAHAGPHA